MRNTHFHDFTRDNGLPVTVEFTAVGGEPDFDYPGHICDGGGSGPEIVIQRAWPNTIGHNYLARAELNVAVNRARFGRAGRALRWTLNAAMRLDELVRARLTDGELQRFEAFLSEHYVEDPYEPEDFYV